MLFEIKICASQIIQDVCIYFLRKTHSTGEKYIKLPSKLYSKFAKVSCIEYIEEESRDFFLQMSNNDELKYVCDEDFEITVRRLFLANNWCDRGHRALYEIIVKIFVFSVSAKSYNFISTDLFHGVIENLLTEAYKSNVLHEKYDKFRKLSQSLFYTIFNKFGYRIDQFTSKAEKVVSWNVINFPTKIALYIQNNLYWDELKLRAYCKTISKEEFKVKVKDEIRRKRAADVCSSRTEAKWLVMIIVCFESLYFARNSLKQGVSVGLDIVTEIIMTKDVSYFIPIADSTRDVIYLS